MKVIKGLESLPYEKKIKEFSCILEKRRLWWNLITIFQYLRVGYKEDKGFLFTRRHIEKTRDNEYKLQ